MTWRPSVERHYVMTKIAPGDYLQPSNDGLTLFRICRGDEVTGDENERRISIWQVWRWRGAVQPGEFADPNDWDRWELLASWFDSRTRAIEWALK